MTIENGYVTLEEFKSYLLRKRSYTAATISFAQSTSTIADTYKRLGRFVGAKLIQISGAANAGNNGIWEATDISNSAIVISGTLTTETIGASITLTDVSDPENDDDLERAIESACRSVEDHCHRKFWKNTEDEERIYTPRYADCIFSKDDIVEIVELATDEDGDGIYERVWLESDYVLWPANAALDNKPYRHVELARKGRYSFPVAKNALQITGVFGWPAVPKQVESAVLLQASRWYERRNSPFGVVAVTDVAAVTVKNDLDPDVQVLLGNLVRQIV